MFFSPIRRAITTHVRILTYLSGSIAVLVWTLLRHINNGINYDVVGQIGVAQQWSNGLLHGSQFGATNYLLKFPLYFLANAMHFISPLHRLLLLAVVCNILTFTLLFFLFEKFTRLYKVKNVSWQYLAIGWLATISGNVFWLDYANSRNLEVVGGIILVFLLAKYIETKNFTILVWLSLIASVVFFADPLQFYIFGLGSCLYTIGRLLAYRRRAVPEAACVLGAVIVGYLGSQIIGIAIKTLLPVSFLAASSTQHKLTLSDTPAMLHNLIVSSFKIFGADFFNKPYGLNTLREIGNALVGGLIIFMLSKILFVKAKRRNIDWLLLACIITNYLIYIASGQAAGWAVERYLIMIPVLTLLLFIIHSDDIVLKYRPKIQFSWMLILVVSFSMVAGALYINWPERHAKDKHIIALVDYLKAGHFSYAVSSREVGVTTTYFGQGKVTVLPMGCAGNHTLYPTNLFYDNAAFESLNSYPFDVPVIVPAGGIKFGTICSRNDIIAEFGMPKQELAGPNGATALVYPSQTLLPDITNIHHK